MIPLLRVVLVALASVGLLAPATAGTTNLRLDHVTIFVPDLERARKNFTALGFTVHPGGTLPGGYDHNAIIPFDDGTYIELFAPTKPGFLAELRGLREEGDLGEVTRGLDAIAQRFVRQQAAGPGLGEFALSPSEGTFGHALGAIRARGLPLSGPMPMVRRFTNGASVRWQIGVPEAAVLPFLISRTPPRAQPLRLSGAPPYRHANGAIGIARVTVLTAELPAALLAYRKLLGELPVASVTPLPGTRSAVFALADRTQIVVAQPTGTRGALARHLRERGAGISAIEVATTALRKARALDRKRAEQALITLIPCATDRP